MGNHAMQFWRLLRSSASVRRRQLAGLSEDSGTLGVRPLKDHGSGNPFAAKSHAHGSTDGTDRRDTLVSFLAR